ncbi:hypothetical protein U2F10_25820 [Leptothoe sp. EHU-05/26/07-4]
MQQQLTTIASPRFSQSLKQLWQPLKAKRHQLLAAGQLDILFIPEQQLAFIAHGNNLVNRYSTPSVEHALAIYKAQRLVPASFQVVTR